MGVAEESDTTTKHACIHAWTELCLPTPNSYVEALTPNVSVFVDRAFRQKLRLNKVIRERC